MIQKILIAIVFISSFNLFAQNIPTSGNSSITTCNTTLYDMGGASGGLTANADGSITIYPATAGNVVAVMVQELDIDWYNDYLYIYDGASTSGTLLRTFQGGWGSSNYIDYREYYGTSGAITIRLKTGQYASSSDAGCLIRVRCAPTAQPNNMVRNQQRIISSCNTTFYDHGGIYGDYQNSSKDTILILPDAPNKFVQLTFQHFALNSNDGYDQVNYLGGMKTSPTSTLYLNSGYSLPNGGVAMVTARSDGAASFILQSDAAYTAQGFRVLVSCSTGTTSSVLTETIVPGSGATTVTSCAMKVSDNGDKYNYFPNSNGSLTINPATAGKKVQLNFSSFNVSAGDALYVYDGTTTGATLLGTYSGTMLPDAITATSANSSGALTVRFTSNGSTESTGFVFNTSCVDPLPETLLPTSGSISLTTCDQTIFDNGGVAANYSNSVNGSLLITPATSGMKVKLHFNTFATEATNDYLTVYNGNSSAAPVIGVFSGTTIPADIVASNASGQLYLTFVSNATVNATGFNAYASCVIPEAIIPVSGSNTFTTCNGYVYDGGGASGNYVDNANGTLTLYPEQAGKYVNLDFTSFSLEQFDTLYVYDGETVSANLLGKYTGTTLPAFVRATAANSSGALTLQFKSNGSLNSPGFAALVSCENAVIGTIIPVSGNSSVTTCNTTVYDAGGSNGNYGSNIDGSMTFYPATAGNMIRAAFSSFSTQSSSDILYVYNGTSTSATLLGQYSGTSLPPTITASNVDGALTIRFQSNTTVNNSGFAISISCALPEVVVPSTGTASITTCNTTIYDAGGATGNYSVNQDGSITVYPATAGMFIRATFNSFNTESTYDVLSVYNGTTTAATLLGSYSGTSLPSALTASNASGALTIRFKTDGSVVNSGFAITLTCVAPEVVIPVSGNTTLTTCSATLFDAGGSTGNYANNQDGSITIYPATVGNKIRAVFSSMSTEATYDIVYVYDGTSTSATLMGQYSGTSIPTFTATNASGALTIRFKSDISNVSSGFAFSVMCIDPNEIKIPASGNTTLTTCNAVVYDGGGSYEVYQNNLDGSITIYPGTTGAKVKASIISFITEGTYDVLSFYDGISTSATLLNSYSGSVAPSVSITASELNTSGALTIRFKTDGSISYAGFAIQVSCVTTPVSGISVDPLNASMAIGNTLQLNKTITPANATISAVTWTSSNTAIATVDANGLVTAVAPGEVNITVTTQDGNFTATSVISVLPVVVTGISIDPTSVSIAEGATVQLTATIAPSDATNKNVTWSTANASIATVDANGLVTGVLAGIVEVTATSVDGNFSAVTTITVTPIPVTGISVNPVSSSVFVGATLTLSATTSPANASNKNVTWISSNNAIASVDANGVVTGVAEGAVDITVTTEDGNFSAVAAVTVQRISVTGISVDPASASMMEGTTKQLAATILPLNATNKNVVWTSTNTSVATVDQNGIVTAIAVGQVEIKVISEDGNFQASSVIQVTPILVASLSVSPATATLVEGNNIQLMASILPLNAANKNVNWTSSNVNVATVDANGLVTTILPGIVQITATSEDGGFTATSEITVTVNTGISNADKANVVFLYPNPASDKVNLVNLKAGMNIRVVNQKGIEVYSAVHTADGALDVSAFDSGVYSVIIGLKETLYVEKLVIVK